MTSVKGFYLSWGFFNELEPLSSISAFDLPWGFLWFFFISCWFFGELEPFLCWGFHSNPSPRYHYLFDYLFDRLWFIWLFIWWFFESFDLFGSICSFSLIMLILWFIHLSVEGFIGYDYGFIRSICSFYLLRVFVMILWFVHSIGLFMMVRSFYLWGFRWICWGFSLSFFVWIYSFTMVLWVVHSIYSLWFHRICLFILSVVHSLDVIAHC